MALCSKRKEKSNGACFSRTAPSSGELLAVKVEWVVLMMSAVSILQNACDILMERLTPYKDAEPDAGWEAWVSSSQTHTPLVVAVHLSQ